MRPLIVRNKQIYNTLFCNGRDWRSNRERAPTDAQKTARVLSDDQTAPTRGTGMPTSQPAHHRKTPVTHVCNWRFRYFFVLGYVTSDLEIRAVFVNQLPTHGSGLPSNLAPNILQTFCTFRAFLCMNLRDFAALLLTRSIHGTDS